MSDIDLPLAGVRAAVAELVAAAEGVVEFSKVRELYFEDGELSTSRGAFEPTRLETEAGFGD